MSIDSSIEVRMDKGLIKHEISFKEVKPPETACRRCGACCERFTLPWGPRKIQDNYEAWVKGSQTFWSPIPWGEDAFTVHIEMARWAPALIPLDYDSAVEGFIFTGDAADKELLDKHRKNNESCGCLYWYGCRYMSRVKGIAHCYIHRYRNYTCRNFLPRSMGGYLRKKESIPYKDCSFRTEHDWEKENQYIYGPGRAAVYYAGHLLGDLSAT